jgi:UDP-N-acetylmuramoyl-tripeptide--D-alanyl-D-alanine ligase
VAEENIRKSIENYVPSNSRSQLMHKGSNKIILDAYNANPSSMKAAIDNFSKTESSDKVLVLGAMAELGHESMQEHQSLVDEIRKYSWKDVILVGGDFLKLKHPYRSFASASEAGQWLKEQNVQNSYLLIKGSRSAQMEKVLEYI